MTLDEVPLTELRRMYQATLEAAGPDAQSTGILLRTLERRERELEQLAATASTEARADA